VLIAGEERPRGAREYLKLMVFRSRGQVLKL